MRSELYAALEERNNALPFPAVLDAGTNAAILASGWETDLLSVGGVLMPWWNAVASVWGAGYIDPTLNGSVSWGGAAPSPFTGVDPSLLGPKWNCTGYWNALRAGILSLSTIRIDLVTGATASSSTATLGGPFGTAALAAADLVGAAQTTAAVSDAFTQIIGFNFTGSYRFSASIFTTGSCAVPSGSAFSGYAVLLTLLGGSNSVATNVAFEFGSGSIATPAPGTGLFAGSTFASGGSGGVSWSIKLPDQANATALATEFGGTGAQANTSSVYMGGGLACAVGLQPTFSFV